MTHRGENMFHEKIQNSLKAIIQEYGHSICKEPSRLEGLLKDYCGEYKKEIFIIVSSTKDGVPGEISGLNDSLEFARVRLSGRLVDNYAFRQDYADATILLWLLVLGKITLAEHNSMLEKCKIKVETMPSQLIPVNQQEETANKIGDFSNSQHTKVGDILYYGRYQQSDDIGIEPKPIAWRVLANENGRVLVLSEKGLDCQPYNTEYAKIIWKDCTLRSWLNKEFLDTAFFASEQKAIAMTSVVNNDDQGTSNKSGNITQDKIFLLSIEEAKKYFSGNSDRVAVNTAYAQLQGAYTSKKGMGWWWLRSPSLSADYASGVDLDGSFYKHGSIVSNNSSAIRPALWLDL